MKTKQELKEKYAQPFNYEKRYKNSNQHVHNWFTHNLCRIVRISQFERKFWKIFESEIKKTDILKNLQTINIMP